MNLPPALGSAPFDRSGRGRRALAALVAAGLTAAAAAGIPGVAHASTQTSVGGAVGEVTVEPADGLPAEGAVVTVTGTGFDTSAGIYVAVCVDNGPGQKPSPCIGGIDTEGQGGATWISDNPPTYAEGLTLPYGPGGSFEVELPVPMVDEVTGVDCREVACAVTVRYDHLRAEDRGADHVIPVTFADADADADAGDEDAGGDSQETGMPDEPPAAAEPDASEDPDGGDASAGDEVPSDDAAQDADADSSDAFPVLPVTLAAAAALLLGTLVLLQRRRRDDGATPYEPDRPGSTDHD